MKDKKPFIIILGLGIILILAAVLFDITGVGVK